MEYSFDEYCEQRMRTIRRIASKAMAGHHSYSIAKMAMKKYRMFHYRTLDAWDLYENYLAGLRLYARFDRIENRK